MEDFLDSQTNHPEFSSETKYQGRNKFELLFGGSCCLIRDLFSRHMNYLVVSTIEKTIPVSKALVSSGQNFCFTIGMGRREFGIFLSVPKVIFLHAAEFSD